MLWVSHPSSYLLPPPVRWQVDQYLGSGPNKSSHREIIDTRLRALDAASYSHRPALGQSSRPGLSQAMVSLPTHQLKSEHLRAQSIV